MTGWKLFISSWEFHPSVVVGCLLLIAVYLYASKGKLDGKTANYSLGVLTIFLALVSPLDELGDDYLFSAHMVQHIMLGVIAPPLMVSGMRESFVRVWLSAPWIARIEQILGNPTLALSIATSVYWLWHYPLLYNATLENEGIHIFEHMTFLVTGTMLWWPVFKPIPEGRLASMPAIIYLCIACFLNAILGVIFTLADTTFYSAYAHPDDDLGALKLIREQWGLTQLNDQKLGGAIMWAFGGLIFLWGIMVLMLDWLSADEPEPEPPERRRTGDASAG